MKLTTQTFQDMNNEVLTRLKDGELMAEALHWLFMSDDPEIKKMMAMRVVAGLVQPAVNRTRNKGN